jgi:hypothetical protein
MQFTLNAALGHAFIAVAGIVLLQRVNSALRHAREVLNLALQPNGLSEKLKGGNIYALLQAALAFGAAVTVQGRVSDPVRHCGSAQKRWAPTSPIGSGAWRFQINCLNVGRRRLCWRLAP